MTLRIRLQSTGAVPGGGAPVEMVGGALTIGRGPENDLSLPDPDRTLSKRHCSIEDHGGHYVLVDISTNGTFLNYSPDRLGDAPAPLNHGDIIQLGDFELVVEIVSAAPAAPADPMAGIAPPLEESAVSHGRAVDARPQQDFVGTLDDPAGKDGGDFLDDLLSDGGGGSAAPPGEAPRPSWERAVIPEDPLEPLDPIPDEKDPFFKAPDQDPFAPSGASEQDHSKSTQDFFNAPKSQAELIPDDWDLEPSAEAPAAAPAASPDNPFAETAPAAPAPEPIPAPDPIPTAQPNPQPSPKPQPSPQPVTSAAPPVSTNAARAFLEQAGAGHLQIPDEELTAIMERLGTVFQAMVAGMREILITRASIKGELRMNRTMIQSGGNNPLKFSISPEQAVEAMVRPSTPGYLDAETATSEALNDIKAHEVAMMTGMEAALKDLLARLDPEKLTDRIETGSSLSGLLGGKKAKYWEAYAAMYSDIAKEAEDDFQSAFGREFARAYEDQLKKI